MPRPNKLIRSISNLKAIEQMAQDKSPLHTLPAAIKILMTLAYILCIISLERHNFTQSLLYAFYPIIAFSISNLDAKILLKKSFFSLAFVFFIAIANFFIEQNLYLALSGFCTLMLKAFLSILAVLILSATTKINDVAQGLRKLHVPCIIVLQLMLSFRYLEILITQAINIKNAYTLRSGKESIPLKDWVKLAGCLILKSIDSASSLYKAMICRGFNAHTVIKDNSHIALKEYFALILFCSICLCLRLINLPLLLNNIFTL